MKRINGQFQEEYYTEFEPYCEAVREWFFVKHPYWTKSGMQLYLDENKDWLRQMFDLDVREHGTAPISGVLYVMDLDYDYL